MTICVFFTIQWSYKQTFPLCILLRHTVVILLYRNVLGEFKKGHKCVFS